MSKTILVIDDDKVITDLMERTLERGGYTTIAAHDGPTGIALYQAENPALIVLDVAMPGMSGFEVASRIRAIEHGENRPRTPIVLVTAYARSFFLSDSSDSGVDSYLTKPILPEKLLSHVDKFLSNASASQSESA